MTNYEFLILQDHEIATHHVGNLKSVQGLAKGRLKVDLLFSNRSQEAKPHCV